MNQIFNKKNCWQKVDRNDQIDRGDRGGRRGFMILHSIVFGSIAIIIVSALVVWAGTNLKVSRNSVLKEKAIQIAEAGIDYYRWHLAHAPQDFQDGTGVAGPYVHDFYDKDNVLIGSYSLDITPPVTGSTIVTIASTGKTIDNPNIERTIRTTMAIPSMAKYAFVANSDMRFGVGTEVFGPIHSNGGIRFDGLAHNIVSSAQTSYDDADHSGAVEFGVHTHVNAPPSSGTNDTFRASEAPPTTPTPTRTDVFEAGRQFPVPAVDFTGLTNDLAQMKADAQASGRYFAASGALGYKITFNSVTSGSGADTFTIQRVNTLRSAPNNCTNTGNQTGWGTWSIATSGGALTTIGTYTIPANGLIFVEDNVWVEGAISNTRVTVASGKFPDNAATRTSITVNEDLRYTYTDGRDVISLVAQNNINVGLFSADTLDIDAALMAQNGRIGRFFYETDCTSGGTQYWHRAAINLYGMIATNLRYGFAYTGSNYDCGGTIGQTGGGYCARNIRYDANLLYGPPPSFPLTSDQYTTISWEEI